MNKIKVYICSVAISTLSFVDKEGARHACARAGNLPFEGLKHYHGIGDDCITSSEERNAIAIVESFSRKNNYQYEVVDVAKLSFLSKLRLKRKGLKDFPTVSYGDKFYNGIPTEDDLEKLILVA
jgi:hypothetical protein